MALRPAPLRPLVATVSLLAASVGLHALVVSGVAGRMGAGPGAPRVQAPVEVALIAPSVPPPAAPVGVDASASVAGTATPPVASAPRARPASRPKAAGAPVPTAAVPAPGSMLAAATPVTPADPSGVASAVVEPDAAPSTVAGGDAEGGAAAPAPGESGGPTAPARADVAGAPLPAGPGAPGAEAGPDGARRDAADDGPVAAAHSVAGRQDPARANLATGPALPALPASQRQRFRVYWGDYTEERSVARLEYHLVRDGERYEIRTAAEAEGLISLVYSGTLSQASVGRLGPAGLEPLQYSEQRGKRPERSVAFDPQAHRLTPSGGRGAPVWLPPGTQDRLSVFYQIGLLVRAEPGRFVAGAVQELPVATMRDVRIERFEVVGDETLRAPGGPIRALHLHRPPPPGTDDPRIDLWLGYDFQMLPVRLRVEDAGRRVLDQVIERGG